MSEERKVVITITKKTEEIVNVAVEFSPIASPTEHSPRTVLAVAALQAIREEIKKHAEEEKEQNS